MRIGKYIIKAILRAVGVFLLCLTIAVACFWGVRAVGKTELYHNAKAETPMLDLELDVEDDEVVIYNDVSYKYNEDILTFLVMGTDSLEKLPSPESVTDYTKGGQADTLFLVVVNPHIEEVKVIAINRNTMAEVDVYDSDNNYIRTDLLQICLQHGYGSGLQDSCERQVSAVSKLFYDLPIHGYLSMNMAAVSILNDSVGGVELEVLENVPWGTDVIAYGEGNVVTLEGMDAYYYLQYRDVEVFDSSTMRLTRQKQYLNALAHKMINKTKEDITFPLTVLDAIKDYMVTDVNISKVTYLASSYIGYEFDIDGIYNLRGETIIGGGGFEEYIVDDDALYELIIDIFYEKVEN